MTFQPSPQQLAIFDAIASADHNILVDAKAGSGKTTTIVEGTKRIPRGTELLPPSIVFLAFNKNIAETLKEKLPRGVQSSTFHSLGFRALKDGNIVDRNVKIDARKCAKLVWNAMDRNHPDVRATIQLVSLAKSLNPTERSEDRTVHNSEFHAFWNNIMKHYDVILENPVRAFNVADKVLRKSNEMLDVIDFDDMLYLPILHGCLFDKQDWIFVDEAQDTNDIQLEILERLQKSRNENNNTYNGRSDIENYEKKLQNSSRLIAVGDPHQAIYGFRGANSDSMSRIAKRFSCKTYPLSVSYRCPKAVVREAQRYLR